MVDLFADIPEEVIESTIKAIRENLDKVELYGGHTLRKHTDIQVQALKYRLTQEDIRYATSFWDMEVAGKKEADIYAEYLYRQYGIVPDWIERDSTNCGNNVTNTLGILRQHQVFPKTILLIQDASMQNRMDAGFRKYLGDCVQIINFASYRVRVEVRDGTLAFSPNDIWGMWSMEEYITLLMGEIPRLLDDENGYGPNGKNFIAHVEIPDQVLRAFEELKTEYAHLIRPAQEQYTSR